MSINISWHNDLISTQVRQVVRRHHSVPPGSYTDDTPSRGTVIKAIVLLALLIDTAGERRHSADMGRQLCLQISGRDEARYVGVALGLINGQCQTLLKKME